MSILHIDSSPRMDQSNSRIVGEYLVAALAQPTIYRDLAHKPLPPISAEDLVGVHGSSDADRASLKAELALSDQLIAELKEADTLVIGAAMHNFGVATHLKRWIDAVCRAGISFKYTENGPIGLLNIKRAVIVTATGGTEVGGDIDFVSPYLEHICRFIGAQEVFHIDLGGSKRHPEQVIEIGKQQADELISALSSKPS